MKAKWLLQTDIFGENLERFHAELKRQDYEYKIVEYKPFQSGEYNQFSDDDCVIFYGSLNLASQIHRTKRWIPGTWYDPINFKCSVYYNYFGEYLFNNFYVMMPLKELNRLKKDNLFMYSFSNFIFIRPDSGFKEFTGQTVTTSNTPLFEIPTLESIVSSKDLDETMLCVVSSSKHIEREWRVVIGNKKFITGCQYKHRMELSVSKDCPQEVIEYSEKVASCEWEPNRMYVMDIAEDLNNNLGLLELNSFSCSGLYDCDISKIVEVGSRIAAQEWDEYNNV